jgi:NADH:ubiquinone oxidoreductase subunit 2 (subunit N)
MNALALLPAALAWSPALEPVRATLGQPGVLAALAALATALLLRAVHPSRPGVFGVLAALAAAASLAPFAVCVAIAPVPGTVTPALAAALAAALLARDAEDRAQSEAALKLTWVLGAAFALSWTGESLLTLAAGTARPLEQWPALALLLDPYGLWSSALSLSLVAGLVLLGGAPFHFWVADLVHGARAWIAPLVVTALQAAGAAWLLRRLEGIAAFPSGAALAESLLTLACALALAGGAATLATQRRPERRVGTLASLHGALALAWLVAIRGGAEPLPVGPPGGLGGWAAHLVLALTGAGALAHVVPVGGGAADAPAPLFRRHPLVAALGGYALLSLAGAPGTPGALVWMGVARQLAVSRHPALLLALAIAWLVAFAVASGELRRAFGGATDAPAPERPVPWPARAALGAATLALVALGAWWWRAA